MNYHDNEDELLRMQSRRRRAGSYGNVPSRSRASSHDGRSFRERESFDSIDDAYFEDEYGCEDGLDIPFSDESSKRGTSQGRSAKEREVFPKTTENPIAVPEISLGQERNPAAIRKVVLSEKDVVKERKNGRCF